MGDDVGAMKSSRNRRQVSDVGASEGKVAVSPGVGFGPGGEGFVRFALVENEHRIRQAARNIKKFLAQSGKTMHNVIPLAQKASG